VNKIPTLYVRDPQDMSRVTREVHPDCQWVIDGEGVPTRKYDGTCVMFDGQQWWARREVKPGKAAPADFVAVEHDEITGKTVGWEPIAQSGFARWFAAALENHAGVDAVLEPGTYELVGPKINGNPEHTDTHQLVRHDTAERIHSVPLDYDGLRERLCVFAYEGIVWHHPDGRMAKLKRKDFPS
jgi:hypothetical protein